MQPVTRDFERRICDTCRPMISVNYFPLTNIWSKRPSPQPESNTHVAPAPFKVGGHQAEALFVEGWNGNLRIGLGLARTRNSASLTRPDAGFK